MKLFICLISCLVLAQISYAELKLSDVLAAAIAQNPTVLGFNTGVQTGDGFNGRITNEGTGSIGGRGRGRGRPDDDDGDDDDGNGASIVNRRTGSIFSDKDLMSDSKTLQTLANEIAAAGTANPVQLALDALGDALSSLRSRRFNTGVQTGSRFRGDIFNSDTGDINPRGFGRRFRGDDFDGDFNTGVQTRGGFSGRIDNRRTGSIFGDSKALQTLGNEIAAAADPVQLALDFLGDALNNLRSRRFNNRRSTFEAGNTFSGAGALPTILGFNTGVQTGDDFSGSIDNRDTGSIFDEKETVSTVLGFTSFFNKLKEAAKKEVLNRLKGKN